MALIAQHLAAMFEAAAEDGLIVWNSAKGVRLPARRTGEVVPPTLEQVTRLYQAAPDWFRPAVLPGAGLGLSQAEATGLTAGRIDWLGRTVRVDRQWMPRTGESPFAPPETAPSLRTIPASGFVLAELGQHVGRWHDGFVLHRDSEPVDHQAFGHYRRVTRKRAGLESLRFHHLRHACASMLISAGCSPKAVSAALGHSAVATTPNLHFHPWSGDEDRIRQSVDEALGNPAEDQQPFGRIIVPGQRRFSGCS